MYAGDKNHKFRLSGNNLSKCVCEYEGATSFICVSHLKCSYVFFLMANDFQSQFFIKYTFLSTFVDAFNCFAP